MNLGIYKPGQGYWVRVMTAVFTGLIVLATASWIWGEMGAVNLPIKSWDLRLVSADGAAAPGDQVELLARMGTGSGSDEVIGSATIDEYAEGQSGLATATLIDPQMYDISERTQYKPDEAKKIRLGEGFSAEVDVATPNRVFQQMYLQAAGAGMVLLIGAAFLYWIVGSNRGSADFLIATDGEMKKVNWSTRRHIIGSTWVVVGACVLIATTLWVVDTGFASFFRQIGVLE